jgi:hypothetical protein
MVELQIVILAVAGSSPVGHPPAPSRETSNSKLKIPKIEVDCHSTQPRDLAVGIWDFRGNAAVACALLKGFSMINPNVVPPMQASELPEGFWLRLFNDEALNGCDDLEKIVIGCELIAALDCVELIAA